MNKILLLINCFLVVKNFSYINEKKLYNIRQKILALSIALFLSTDCFAELKILRDSELEEVVNLTVSPLKDIASTINFKILIVDDPVPNIYSAGDNTIYVNSGLIIYFPDPDILRGLVAHELAHIMGKHTIYRQEIINNYHQAQITSTAIGLVNALQSDSSPFLDLASGKTKLNNNQLSLTYDQEDELKADEMASKLLEQSGHSSIGLINFFEQMSLYNDELFTTSYDETHPLAQERLLLLKSFFKLSKYKNSQTSTEISYLFTRSAAKLAGFTLNPEQIEQYINIQQDKEIINYIKAASSFRAGQIENAINYINKLIISKPNDPFFHELKAQIFFKTKRNLALSEYTAAAQLRPHDALIRLGKGISGMDHYANDLIKLTEYYKDLRYVTKHEPDNLLARRYLAIFYDRKGIYNKRDLELAQVAIKSGDKQKAKELATKALETLSTMSDEWEEAQSIVSIADQK